MMQRLILGSALLLSTVTLSFGQNVNPVSPAITNSGLDIHLQVFAKVPPRSNGGTARLNCLTHAGGRLFVVESLEGLIYEVTGGNVRLFFDMGAALQATGSSLETTNAQHGGLRSVAFHPGFGRNGGKFYTSEMQVRPADTSGLTYLSDVTTPVAGDSVVTEWRASSNGTVSPSSRREILRVGMPVYDHPIKQIAFNPHATTGSPDYRMLYITHGDGSVQSATAGGGRNRDALGKVLRIFPDTQFSGRPYDVPPSNPFVGNASMLDEVYSLGHRNPHNLGFSKDGTIIVVDAGRDNVDEINIINAGGDYGWAEREGTFVHLESGGLVNGIAALPSNDAQFGYTYPSAQVGHYGPIGSGIVGQAQAGGSAIENGSALSGLSIYGEFALTGEVYHSSLNELKSAVTVGDPSGLTQATTSRFNVWFDHDSNSATPNQSRNSLLDVFNDSPDYDSSGRADTRFGQGPGGELYITSKRNNTIYLVSNSNNDWSGNGSSVLSINKGFESDLSGWTSFGPFPADHATRDWTPDANDPDEGGLGSRFLYTATDNVGFGQYVVLDGSPQNVLSIQGYKDGGWAAYGITYYDANWNEIGVRRQRLGEPTERSRIFSRGAGDGIRPYSIGTNVPANATFAYIWVWNGNGGGLAVDEFQLAGFRKSTSTNLLTNGNFATGWSTSTPSGGVRNSGQDFWEMGVGEDQDDLTISHDGYSGSRGTLEMGALDRPDLIYQRVNHIQGGNDYSLRVNYTRGSDFRGEPGAYAGVDLFDADGNKVGARSIPLNGYADALPNASEAFSFRAEAGAVVGYVWVWIDTAGRYEGLNLKNVSLEP